MPNQLPKMCETCRQPFTGSGWTCAACRARQPQQSSWRTNKKLYQSRDWRNTSSNLRGYNVLCQRVDQGEQCTRPSEQVHHLRAPETHPTLALDWTNLVAVCFTCHPASQAGAADDERYVPTLGAYDSVYYHGRHTAWLVPAQASPTQAAAIMAAIQDNARV